MSAIKEILDTTRANIAVARNGDPGPAFDCGIEAAECLEKVLTLVLIGDASAESVEHELRELRRMWQAPAGA